MKPRTPQVRTPQPRLLACALASCFLVATPALLAQSTAATLRGQVTETSGSAANAEVTVTNLATGLIRKAQSNANGEYSLAGLPPGTYRVDVNAGAASTSKTVILRVGQIATLDLPLEAASAAEMATISVTANAMAETKTSEIATYITPKQIEALPQTSRNFLAFADTVPGVIYTRDENNGSSSLRGGAQNSNGVNVYIDGVGQKNYVLKGGISGQDQTRGNPFPQAAIAEYKVITQNYKAEFDQLSSVAITALTKSGSNEFHGDFFYDYTNQDMRATRPTELGGDKKDTKEKQYGLSFGGPIIQDQLFFFGSYERKEFVTPSDINPGESVPVSSLPAEVQGLVGPTTVPFNEDLYFGKLTWTPNESSLFELTGKYRKEDQIDGIGGVNTYGFGSTRKNDESRIDLRYQYINGDWLNDAHLTFEDSTYEPRPTTTDGYGIHLLLYPPNDNNGRTVLNYGAGENFQRKGQQGTGIQDDLTWSGLEWAGNHTFKAGFKYKEIKINSFEQQPYSPQYYYDINESYTVPAYVEFGQLVPGAPQLDIKSKNQQFGIYLQDDWEVNTKLILNLGIRWDYEKTPSYLNFQPRPELAAALRNWANIQNTDYNIEDFIGNGHNRKAFKDAWQPRVGFSYDLFEDQRHVLFGGAGRSYDRNLFDYLALERSKGTFPRYRFNFNTPAHPCVVGVGACLAWDAAYLDPANLAPLVAANPNLGGETNLINNNLKTPYSDQLSFGMRNTVTLFGIDWNTSATLSHVESKDGIYFALGNRYADGRFRFNPAATWGGQPWGEGIPGFGTLLIADNGIETRNDSFLLSIEKPYTPDSGWGMTLAYTYNHPFENRLHAAESDEHYIFDYPNTAGQGFLPSLGIPRHRLVLTGIVDGPWGTTLSGKATYSSPIAKEGLNCSAIGFNDCFFDPFSPAGTFGIRQVDLAATKTFEVGKGIGLRVRADILNIFNTYNWTDYDTWHGGPTDPNPNFGNRNGDGISTPTRTLKLSIGASF
ncbi:MAG: TonB-dependent receptor [Xanthomonadales bacterium]|nr:TonB-dependent receptor [Xanthomonadales bacterium]